MTTDELLEKATERPWKVGVTESHLGDAMFPRSVANYSDRGPIEFDAELTRRAVNSFEAMRKALETAAKLLSMVPVDDDMDLEFGKAADDCRAALKLANGEE